MSDRAAIARRLRDAFAARQAIVPPSSVEPGFDLAEGYAVEAELVRLRRAEGHLTVGLKVGYANKALWRALKLDTLVWAHMYDDTVRFAEAGEAALALDRFVAPKIEPEVVFKLNAPLTPPLDAAAVLESVEWIALGCEIINVALPRGGYQPSDFVAAYGLHAALIVGEPQPVDRTKMAQLLDELSRFTVRLWRNGALAAEGTGRNALRSPALCLAELASAITRQPGAEPLMTGDLISSGSLTDAQPLHPGETWQAIADGIDLPGVTLRT